LLFISKAAEKFANYLQCQTRTAAEFNLNIYGLFCLDFKVSCYDTGFQHIFKNHFSHFFSIPNEKTLKYHHLSSFFQNFISGTKCKKQLQTCHQQ